MAQDVKTLDEIVTMATWTMNSFARSRSTLTSLTGISSHLGFLAGGGELPSLPFRVSVYSLERSGGCLNERQDFVLTQKLEAHFIWIPFWNWIAPALLSLLIERMLPPPGGREPSQSRGRQHRRASGCRSSNLPQPNLARPLAEMLSPPFLIVLAPAPLPPHGRLFRLVTMKKGHGRWLG